MAFATFVRTMTGYLAKHDEAAAQVADAYRGTARDITALAAKGLLTPDDRAALAELLAAAVSLERRLLCEVDVLRRLARALTEVTRERDG